MHFAEVGADIVILDVERDQYHCLPGAAAVMRVDLDGRIHTSDPAALVPLLEAGLVYAEPPGTPTAPIKPAVRELPPGAPSRGDIVRIGVSLAACAGAFRGKSLARLTKSAYFRPPAARPDEDRLARLVSAARVARLGIPFEGECLQRAFQLRRLLGAHGLTVDWVFGVRTWPFGAHCWLQGDDLVIGDRLERIVRYTPILRV